MLRQAVILFLCCCVSLSGGNFLARVGQAVRGTASKVRDRVTRELARGRRRFTRSAAAARNVTLPSSSVVIDVTELSAVDTVEMLRAENDELRRTNAALRVMVRQQKRQLAEARKDKESIRRELQARLDAIEVTHVRAKEELQERLRAEHQQEMAAIKAELTKELGKKANEAEKAVKDVETLKRELHDKEAAVRAAHQAAQQAGQEKEALAKELAAARAARASAPPAPPAPQVSAAKVPSPAAPASPPPKSSAAAPAPGPAPAAKTAAASSIEVEEDDDDDEDEVEPEAVQRSPSKQAPPASASLPHKPRALKSKGASKSSRSSGSSARRSGRAGGSSSSSRSSGGGGKGGKAR